MSVKVSKKYQVVIPKAVRKQVSIKPGQKLTVKAGKDGSIVLKTESAKKVDSLDEWIEKYAGVIKTSETAWGKAGMDAAEWIRKQRDEEWD